MANAGTVNVSLVVDHSSFVAGIEKGAQAVEKLQGSVETAKHALELFGIALGLREILEFGKSTIEAIDRQAKLADRLGITTQALGGFQYAATASGVATDTLNGAITKMEKNISEAATSGGKAGKALAELHIPMKDIIGLSPDAQFKKIADALNGLDNAGDRTRLTMALFGKQGAEILPVLEKGSKGLSALQEEAVKLGVAVSRVDASKVEQAAEAMNKTQAAFQGVANTAAIQLAPVLVGIADKITNLMTQGINWRDIMTSAVSKVVDGIVFMGRVWDAFVAAWAAFKMVVDAAALFVLGFIQVTVKGVQLLGDVWKNWTYAIQDTMREAGANVNVLWDGIKVGVGVLVQFVASKFALMLDEIGKGVRRFNETLADAMDKAAGSIRASTGTMAGDAEVAFRKAQLASTQAAEQATKSWNNLFNVNPQGSTYIANLIEGFKIAGQDSAAQFLGSFNKMLNGSGGAASVRQYLDQVQADVAKTADAKGAAIAKEQAAARAAAVENAQLHAKEMSDIDAYLAKLDTGFRHDILVENQRYEAKKKLLDDWHKENIDKDAEYHLMLEKMNEEHQARLNNIESQAAKKNREIWESGLQGKLEVTGSVLQSLSQMMNSKNREMFEVGKAAAYASTVVNTAQAAMGAYSAMASIPYVGPFLGAAAAAAAVAAGAMQLATISGTSFSGGGSPSAPSSGGITAAGGAMPAGVAAGSSPGGQPQSTTIQISGLSDNQLYSGAAIRNLIDQLNNAGLDGAGLQVLQVA